MLRAVTVEVAGVRVGLSWSSHFVGPLDFWLRSVRFHRTQAWVRIPHGLPPLFCAFVAETVSSTGLKIQRRWFNSNHRHQPYLGVAMKATPKSCSCGQCKHAKHTGPGNRYVKLGERAFRHASNQALRQGKEDITPAGCRDRLG